MTKVDTVAMNPQRVLLFGQVPAQGLAVELGRIVHQLAQRVTKQELAELRAVAQRLAVPGKQLAEPQRSLAEAQSPTEEQLRSSMRGLRQSRKMLGGHSRAAGYTLEHRSARSLTAVWPALAGLAGKGPSSRTRAEDAQGKPLEMQRFFAQGFRAVAVCLSTEQLDTRFVGRTFGERLLSGLPCGIDPCGENPEFHSFVYDGPPFHHPVHFPLGETVLRDARYRSCPLPLEGDKLR